MTHTEHIEQAATAAQEAAESVEYTERAIVKAAISQSHAMVAIAILLAGIAKNLDVLAEPESEMFSSARIYSDYIQ